MLGWVLLRKRNQQQQGRHEAWQQGPPQTEAAVTWVDRVVQRSPTSTRPLMLSGTFQRCQTLQKVVSVAEARDAQPAKGCGEMTGA